MSVLNDLRQRFLRKKTNPTTAKESPASRPARTEANAAAAVASPPPRPAPPRGPARDPESERKNLDTLLGEIDNRLGKQRAETERLVQPIRDLPGAVQAITEVKTQCGRMLELITSHVEDQRDQDRELGAIDASMGQLRDASSQQAEVLDGIRKQVEMNTQAIKHSSETYEAVIQHVAEVHKACCKIQESLGTIASAGRGETDAVSKALARQERLMKLVAVGAGAAALVAIVVAVIGLL